MTKQMIEVDIPEGYEFVRYGIPKKGDYFMTSTTEAPLRAVGGILNHGIILKKKQPERIIFEKSFEKRHANYGEHILDSDGDILMWTLLD